MVLLLFLIWKGIYFKVSFIISSKCLGFTPLARESAYISLNSGGRSKFSLITISHTVACKNFKVSDNFYEFEPEENEILEDLLPRNISTQIFKAFLENAASEQGSRMTAMDSATRNAGDLVDKLTITYNRSRQAAITKELIEIISGAESL